MMNQYIYGYFIFIELGLDLQHHGISVIVIIVWGITEHISAYPVNIIRLKEIISSHISLENIWYLS